MSRTKRNQKGATHPQTNAAKQSKPGTTETPREPERREGPRLYWGQEERGKKKKKEKKMKFIDLTRGQRVSVDDEDYNHLALWKWYAFPAKQTFYAARTVHLPNGKTRTVLMHRVIMGLYENKAKVDHIDRIGLNNQRYNLRIVDNKQNARNNRGYSISGYKGVCSVKTGEGKFKAQITVNYKTKYLGTFLSAQAAAQAYDKAARKHFGEFACLNFPEEKG
jgi:hypothetical protein